MWDCGRQIVREKLSQMELPHIQHTTVRGSPKRQLLADKYGKFAVPYLEVLPSSDPFAFPQTYNPWPGSHACLCA